MRNFKVTVNGNEYEVSVEEIGVGGMPAAAPAPQPEAPKPAVVAPKPVAAPAAAPKPIAAGGSKVESPMPGMVVGFKVADGATVKKGDAILVLEAMKMENDIAATADGVVSFVAAKGANVNTGDLLAVIK